MGGVFKTKMVLFWVTCPNLGVCQDSGQGRGKGAFEFSVVGPRL